MGIKNMLFVLAIASAANAATNNGIFYLLDGKTVAPEEAIIASVKGDKVFKCQPVEAKVSKTGTSIGLKNVKKKKAQD